MSNVQKLNNYINFIARNNKYKHRKYRVVQEELPLLTELISDDILSKKCHINLGPILNIYRVTFVYEIFV
jgi:hypothetical protein